MNWHWPIPCSNNIQGGCIPGPLREATPGIRETTSQLRNGKQAWWIVALLKLQPKVARIQEQTATQIIFPRGEAESQADEKTNTVQHSASESRGTRERESSTVCSRGTNRFTALEAAQNEVTPEDIWKGTKTVLLKVAREMIESVKSQKKKKSIY